MIGFYDYTVILTYCSVISAVAGIAVTLSGSGHPFFGILFLMFCGLCDAFDGKVARTKTDRSKSAKNFGIQIDSLSDLIAFGVLPVCIGVSMWSSKLGYAKGSLLSRVPLPVIIIISCIYILATVIRLAYFNVTEDEIQSSGNKKREFYTGLPVTSASLIFPTFMMLQYAVRADISFVYYIVMLFVAVAFVGNFKVRKPGLKMILIMVGIGAIEFGIILLLRIVMHHV